MATPIRTWRRGDAAVNLAAYVALFGAGVASFLAPCVVPLVPAYLGMLAGSAASDRPSRVVTATGVFVAGFTAVFALFGVLAGLAGSRLAGVQTWVQRIGGVLVLACEGLRSANSDCSTTFPAAAHA
jgi:cytochrome c biogenesis protein CcdA